MILPCPSPKLHGVQAASPSASTWAAAFPAGGGWPCCGGPFLPSLCPASPFLPRESCDLSSETNGEKKERLTGSDWFSNLMSARITWGLVKTHLLHHLPASDVIRSGVGPENPHSNKFRGDGGGAAGPQTTLRTAGWEAYVSSGGTEVSSEVLRNLTHSPLCSPSPTTTRLSSQGVWMWRKESEPRAFTSPSDHWAVKPWFTSTKTH